MLWKDIKLENRSDKEPKFDGKNKTDRKIVLTVVIASAILIALIVGLVIIYYQFFYGGSVTSIISESTSTSI